MLPKLDTEVTSLRRNQTLSEESLPYRLELGQHHIKPKIKYLKLKLQFKSQKIELVFEFPFVISHFITYDVHHMTAAILPNIFTSSQAS